MSLGDFQMFKSFFRGVRPIRAAILVTLLIFSSSFSTTALAKRSPEEVFKYQKHMAQAGYASAIYKLAVMYQNGYGTERNLKRALELYKESAAKGYKKAEARVTEVEIMIESGDFNPALSNAKQKALEEEKARIAKEREKLRKEKEAIESARREQQLKKQQAANAKNKAEQNRLAAERRKLNEEMARLREEKARLARENLAMERAKQQSMEEEMRLLEESTMMLMDNEGMSAEERATIELLSE